MYFLNQARFERNGTGLVVGISIADDYAKFFVQKACDMEGHVNKDSYRQNRMSSGEDQSTIKHDAQ